MDVWDPALPEFHLAHCGDENEVAHVKPFRALTSAQQLAERLRAEIAIGSWGGSLPGVHRLAKELGVSAKTVVAAMAQLGHEGVLSAQGARRRQQIVPDHAGQTKQTLRVGILLYDAVDRSLPYMVDLHHRLEDAGHVAFFAEKTLIDLRREVPRVAAYVESEKVDAWLVQGGSQEVLEWFAVASVPAFAMFGRRRGVNIAAVGPDKVPAVRELVEHLCRLGHRRIVMMVRGERRKPTPGAKEMAFLDCLQSHDIPTGDYNLPDWEETPEGFLKCLDQLSHVTPPTALILDEPFAMIVAQQHLARKGILAPERVSLACCDPHPIFPWMKPGVAHIHWDTRPVVRRVVDWVDKLAAGKNERRQLAVKAVFVPGGTIGPPPK